MSHRHMKGNASPQRRFLEHERQRPPCEHSLRASVLQSHRRIQDGVQLLRRYLSNRYEITPAHGLPPVRGRISIASELPPPRASLSPRGPENLDDDKRPRL